MPGTQLSQADQDVINHCLTEGTGALSILEKEALALILRRHLAQTYDSQNAPASLQCSRLRYTTPARPLTQEERDFVYLCLLHGYHILNIGEVAMLNSILRNSLQIEEAQE